MTNEVSAPQPSAEPLVYEINELAALLHLSPRTIGNMLRLGRLVGRKVGRRTLIPRTSVESFLKRDHPGRTAFAQKPKRKEANRDSATPAK